MPQRADRPMLGIIMMLIAVGVWALHDAFSKELAAIYPPAQILFLRSAAATALVAGFIAVVGGAGEFRSKRPGLNIVRGLLSCGAFSMFVIALPMQPLVSTFAILASAPLFITILSIPILKEPVGVRRWLAVVGGFVAILFMMQPGSGLVPLASGLLIASNILYSVSVILSRLVGRHDGAGIMTLYTLVVFVVINAFIVPFSWQPPTTADWGVFVLTGFLAATALYTMTIAFRVATPSLVAPYEYTGVAWAALFGWIFWCEVPTWIVIWGFGRPGPLWSLSATLGADCGAAQPAGGGGHIGP
jgi:drug/metabolite transporter (DMT)-like permease